MADTCFSSLLSFRSPQFRVCALGWNSIVLIPIESEKKDNDEERIRLRRLEADRILSQFRSLSVTEQEEQRKLWTDDLKLV